MKILFIKYPILNLKILFPLSKLYYLLMRVLQWWTQQLKQDVCTYLDTCSTLLFLRREATLVRISQLHVFNWLLEKYYLWNTIVTVLSIRAEVIEQPTLVQNGTHAVLSRNAAFSKAEHFFTEKITITAKLFCVMRFLMLYNIWR